MDGKLWQVGVVVLGIAVFAVSMFLFFSGGDSPDRADKIFLADVTTGEIFEMPRTRGVVAPARHPETGKRTLLPVSEENGVWKVDGRYLGKDPDGSLQVGAALEGEPDAMDLDSGVIDATGPPKRM